MLYLPPVVIGYTFLCQKSFLFWLVFKRVQGNTQFSIGRLPPLTLKADFDLRKCVAEQQQHGKNI